MDTRLDAVAKAVARGATRRQALRLAGGGLAGALLAAAGLGKRAGAHGPMFAYCENGLFIEGELLPYVEGQGTDDFELHAPCGPAYGCHEGEICATALNPGNQIVCRCLRLG